MNGLRYLRVLALNVPPTHAAQIYNVSCEISSFPKHPISGRILYCHGNTSFEEQVKGGCASDG